MGQKHSRHVIIVVIGLILVFALTGCSSGKVKFQESEFSGTEGYPESFPAHSVSNSQFTLHIHDQLYDPETSSALYEAILADYTHLADLLALDTALEIILVPETPSGDVLTADNLIYCTSDDVLEGGYREALVKAFSGFDQLWKLAGVYGLAFGDEVDEAELVEYYSDEENMSTLSLFPAYFLDAYNGRITLSKARDTAISFANYILTTEGAEVLAQPIGQDDYRQAWLDSLGVTLPWQALYDLSFLDNAQFSSSEDYELIITTGNHVYSFTDNIVEDPRAIIQVLAYYHTGCENLMAVFESEAPEHYAEIEAIWEGPIHFYFDGNLLRSYNDRDELSLYFPSTNIQDLFNSTFFFLFPEPRGENQIWKQVGLGDYTLVASGIPEWSYYGYLQRSPDDLTGDDAEFLREVQAYYTSQAPYPEELDDFDFGLLYEAMAIVPLQNTSLNVEYPRLVEFSVAQWSNQENQYSSYPGNSLTYPQAYLFTKYLVDTYGLDAVLNYYNKTTTSAFESTFGQSYSAVFAEFKTAYGLSK